MGAGAGVGTATNIIGGEMQGWAALLEQRAMYEALQKQMQAQQGFQNQGVGSLMSYLPSQGRAATDQGLGQATAQRQAMYQQAPALPGATAQDKAAINLAGQQRAGLGAYGDVALGQQIGSGRMQDTINRISSRAGGSAGVFPYQLDRAQHSWDTLAAIGAAISSIGGSSADYSKLFGQRPQAQQMMGQVQQAWPTGQGYGGAGVDGPSTMGSPYANIG